MSVIATAVAALIEAGVTGEALVAAIARMEAAQAAAQQPTRTLRQERNARYYQNRKTREATSEASENVLIQTIETNSDGQKEGPQTPKKNTTPSNSTASATKRTKRQKPEGTLCPDDFRPSDAHYAKCTAKDAPASVADETCQKMHRWSHEHADRDIAWKANWSLALHHFLDGEIEKYHRRAAAARASPAGQKPSSHGPLARLADRMGIPDDRTRQSHASSDHGPVIDHSGDGPADRGLFEPARGYAGRSETPAYLSIVRAARG
jgi:hypothetical protein